MAGLTGAASGPTLPGGADTMRAWTKWTNAHGGINGYCVNLTYLDDQNSPSLALADAKQLVEQDHVVALLGVLDQQTNWTTFIDSAGVPVVGGGNDDLRYSTDKNFYPEGGTITTLLQALEVTAKSENEPKIGLLYCTIIANCTALPALFKANAAKTGADLAYSSSFNVEAPNFTAPCLAMKQAHVQAVYLTGIGATYKQMEQQCALQNFNPDLLAADGLLTGDWAGKGGVKRATIVTGDFPYYDDSTAAEQAFHSAMNQYYPKDMQNPQAEGDEMSLEWTSGQLFAAAAKAAGLGANPTPAQVKSGLAMLHNETLGGLAPPLTFTPGQTNPGATCYFVEGVQNANFVLPRGLTPQCLPSS